MSSTAYRVTKINNFLDGEFIEAELAEINGIDNTSLFLDFGNTYRNIPVNVEDVITILWLNYTRTVRGILINGKTAWSKSDQDLINEGYNAEAFNLKFY
jgi:hypothetical protein